MDSIFKALILPMALLLLLVVVGTTGYMWVYHISFLDAIQLVIVTLSTCGLRQPTAAALTPQARIFDMSFIVVSFIVIISVVSKAFSLVVEGQLKGIQAKERINKVLKKIKNHYIICGYGRVGKQVLTQLRADNIPLVIIDSNPAAEETLKEEGAPFIIGNISSDEVLKSARIDLAKGLVACADSDVENVFVTLSARTMNPGLNIIARASDIANEEKMKRAGADHIISPYLTAGQKISSMIMHPVIADFLDNVMHNQSLEIWFQEIKLPKNCKVSGKTLKELDVHSKLGLIIMAIKHKDGTFTMSLDAQTEIQDEDILICIGNNTQVANFKKLF